MPNAPYTSSTNPTGAAPTRFGKITAQIVRSLLGDIFEFLSNSLRIKKPLVVTQSLTLNGTNQYGFEGNSFIRLDPDALLVTDGADYPQHRLYSNGEFTLGDGRIATNGAQLSINMMGDSILLAPFMPGGLGQDETVYVCTDEGFIIRRAIGTGSTGMVGAFDPEGSLAASPGTTYFNTVLKTFWVKETGTGVLGWLQLL